MKKLIIILVFVIFSEFTSPSPAQGRVKQDTPGYQTNIYFEYAKKAANWLKSLAVEEANGAYKWPTTESSDTYRTGIDTGAAGVGWFFLELYNVTKDSEYLEYAEGAGRFLLNNHYTGGEVDWLNGAAGVGHYFIELWKTTNNPLYLDEANRIGNWLTTQCSQENGGYFWVNFINPSKVYTSYAHGASGIGDFFARLYDVTNDLKYLNYARGAATWLFSYMWELEPGQYCWPRLTTDNSPNTTWCGGSVGILLFLFKLYDSTGEMVYLNHARGGTDWLVAQAADGGNHSYKWSYGPSSHSYPFAYCHGTPSVVHILYEMHRRTDTQQYLEFARGGAKWLQKEAEAADDHVFTWPHIKGLPHDTGLLTGTAGVGNSFAIYYSYDSEPNNNYLEYAKGAAHWLMSAAEFPSLEKVKWINYVDPMNEDYEAKNYQTSWYKGVSGVGLFFLHLSQTLPPPPAGNIPPVLNSIGNKTIRTGQSLTFSTSGQDPDESPGPLISIAGNLPQGALFKDNNFSWTPGLDQAGVYDVYFLVTDGWDADWEHITINVTKFKKGKIKR